MFRVRVVVPTIGMVLLAATSSGCSDSPGGAEPGSGDCTARLIFEGASFTEVGFTHGEVAEPVGTGAPIDCADGAAAAPSGPTPEGVPVYSFPGYDPSEAVVALRAGSSYRVYAADSLTDAQEIEIRRELGTAD